ncbi:MAG TPA: hypothetical protein VJ743_07985 [Albitalea sp.]|nr:hypothetical protein [Albitalea sp.]
MTPTPAARAMTAAAVSLLVFGGCLYMFLPPMVNTTTASVPRIVFFGLAMATALFAHLVFIGIAAHRLGRRAWLWVAIALIGFPISSIVGMIVLAFLDDEHAGAPAAGTR